MSFPYISDVLNFVLGTDLRVPIPTFGLLLVFAIVMATLVAVVHVKWQEAAGTQRESVHSVVGDLSLVSAVAGIVGARLFHIADHFGEFVSDPVSMIFTRSGFSIYGGICFGVLAGIVFLKRRGIPVIPMLDAVSPAIMLGYGIGRIGCQVAGDGDWGIMADMSLKPGWLPDWMWAQTYDGNILGVVIPAPGVYPTPLYESVSAILLFAALWTLRLSRQQPGNLFSVYLLLAGFERLLIEKIRVNIKHDFFGYLLTQAELISLVIIIAGLVGVLLTLNTRAWWVKVLISLGVLSGILACVSW